MNLYENNLYSLPIITGVDNTKTDLYKAYIYSALYDFGKHLNVELDIQKTSLFINSGFFEVNFLRYCKSLKSARKFLLTLSNNNMPIFRLYKFNKSQLNYHEQIYKKELNKQFEDYLNSSVCHSCKYYKKEYLPLGLIEKCTHRDSFKKLTRDFKVKSTCNYYEKIKRNYIDEDIIPKTIKYIDINQKLDISDCFNYIYISKQQLIMNIKILDCFLRVLDNCPNNYEVEINKAIKWAINNYYKSTNIPNYFYYNPIKRKQYRRNLNFIKQIRK